MASSQIKTITYGPQNFVQGISPLQIQQGAFGGFFASAKAIDVYRNPGFISPSSVPLAQIGSVSDLIVSMGGTNPNGNLFYATSSTKLYQILASSNTISSAGGFPHTFSAGSASRGNSIITYAIQGTSYLFYFLNDDFGRFDFSSTFVDNWGSTVPAVIGSPGLFSSYSHKAIIFNNILYFTNGNYVGQLDGTTGTNGTVNYQKFRLPAGYIAKDIRIVQGNLEIYITSAFDSSSIGAAQYVTWDGVSTLALDYSDVSDNYIGAGESLDGVPYLFTGTKHAGMALRRKNYYGYAQIQLIKGVGMVPNHEQVDGTNSMIIWGNSTNNQIYGYGTAYPTYSYRDTSGEGAAFPEALHNLVAPTGTTVGAVYNSAANVVYVSSFTGSNFYLEAFPLSNATTYDNTNATFTTNFQQLPDDSVIEWIKFYVVPPAAGAAFTPVIYSSLSTSPISLTDGDLTSLTLDSSGNSKTYYGIGLLADSIAIGGTWTNSSSTANSVIITRIDVGYRIKASN